MLRFLVLHDLLDSFYMTDLISNDELIMLKPELMVFVVFPNTAGE